MTKDISHELTHFIESNSKLYGVLSQLVKETIGEEAYMELVTQKAEEYASRINQGADQLRSQGKTDEQVEEYIRLYAESEAIAYSMEKLLDRPGVMRRLTGDQRTALRRFFDKLKEICAKLRGLFTKEQLPTDIRDVLAGNEKVADAWINALTDASLRAEAGEGAGNQTSASRQYALSDVRPQNPTYEQLLAKPDIRVIPLVSPARHEGNKELSQKYGEAGFLSRPYTNKDTGEAIFIPQNFMRKLMSNPGILKALQLEVLPQIIEEAVFTGKNPHRANENPASGLLGTYSLFGAVSDGERIIPVKLTVKTIDGSKVEVSPNIAEYMRNTQMGNQVNKLYDSRILELESIENLGVADVTDEGQVQQSVHVAPRFSIPVGKLLEMVVGDARKYIPFPTANLNVANAGRKSNTPTQISLRSDTTEAAVAISESAPGALKPKYEAARAYSPDASLRAEAGEGETGENRFSQRKDAPGGNYESYLTEEAKRRYSNDARFHKPGKEWAHPELAYITAAAWDQATIPFERLMSDPVLQEAQRRTGGRRSLKDDYPFGRNKVLDRIRNTSVDRLFDAEHGSAVLDETGKIVKINGQDQYTGPVDRERKAFFVIGRPAGGKSSVFADPLSGKNHARIIDADTVKPWFGEYYDNGYGAGYVQEDSSGIAEAAFDRAVALGENIVIPKIGGNAILGMARTLKENGYQVELYYNEVSEESSIMRAASRFAEKGRYLSLEYLMSIGDKPLNTFIQNAEGELFDYAEWRNNDVALGAEPELIWKTGDGTLEDGKTGKKLGSASFGGHGQAAAAGHTRGDRSAEENVQGARDPIAAPGADAAALPENKRSVRFIPLPTLNQQEMTKPRETDQPPVPEAPKPKYEAARAYRPLQNPDHLTRAVMNREENNASSFIHGEEETKEQSAPRSFAPEDARGLLEKVAADWNANLTPEQKTKLGGSVAEIARVLRNDPSPQARGAAMEQLTEIAKTVLKTVTETADGDTANYRLQELRAYFTGPDGKKVGFSLSDKQKAEVSSQYGSYGSYRSQLLGVLNISDKQGRLDGGTWRELSQRYPDLFPADTTEGEQPSVFFEAVRKLQNPISYAAYGADNIIDAGEAMASELYDGIKGLSTERTRQMEAERLAKKGRKGEKQPQTRSVAFKRNAERVFTDTVMDVFGIGEENAKLARESVRTAFEGLMTGGEITAEQREGLFNDLWQLSPEQSQTKARNQFQDAVFSVRMEMGLVDRYESAQYVRQSERARRRQTAKDMVRVKEALSQIKRLQREYDSEAKEMLLTDYDRATIDAYLAGVKIDPDFFQGRTDYARLMRVIEAKRELNQAQKLVQDFNKARKKELFMTTMLLTKGSGQWKDKKTGLQYSAETMERNLQDIIGDQVQAMTMIQAYLQPVHENEAAANRWKNTLRDGYRALQLTADEAVAVQYIGEGKGELAMREALGKRASEIDMEKVNRGVAWFRKTYDELLRQANEVLMRNGYPAIEYRKDYFPHFLEPEADTVMKRLAKAMGLELDGERLPTDCAGLTAFFLPGKQFFSHFLERAGDRTIFDACKGLDIYIEGLAGVIYHTDDIQNLRALENALRFKHSSQQQRARMLEAMQILREDPDADQDEINRICREPQGQLSNLVQELREYTNLLANKKSIHDRGMEADIGRRAYHVANKLESRVSANMIALNAATALTNFIPLTQAAASIEQKYMLAAMYDTVRAYGKEDGFVDRSTFLTNRRGSDALSKTSLEKAESAINAPFLYIDSFTADSIVRARYAQNMDKGMDAQDAMAEADYFAAGVMADRSKGAAPTIFGRKNLLWKMVTMFQTETNNQLRHLFKDIPREKAREGLAAIAAAIMKMCIGAWLYNNAYERIAGRRPALDPVNMIDELLGDLFNGGVKYSDQLMAKITGKELKHDPDAASRAGEHLLDNVADALPFIGSLLGGDGGRLPIGSAIPDIPGLIRGESDLKTELKKPLTYLLPPFAGGQLKKTIEGVQTVLQGGSYKHTAEGDQLQFRTDQTVLDYIQAAMFGKWALPEGQKYLKTFDRLSVNDTQGYLAALEAGVDGTHFLELRNRLREISTIKDESGNIVSTSTEQKRRLLFEDKTLTPEQKTLIDKTLIDGESTVDYSSEGAFEASIRGKKTQLTAAELEQTQGIGQDVYLQWKDAYKGYQDKYSGEEGAAGSAARALQNALMNENTLTPEQKTAIEQALRGENAATADYSYGAMLESIQSGQDAKQQSAQAGGIDPDTYDHYAYLYDQWKEAYTGTNTSYTQTLREALLKEESMSGYQKCLAESLLTGGDVMKDLNGAVAKGITAETFYRFHAAFRGLNAQDEQGNSVAGLKKKRTIELVESLGLTTEQEDYLMTELTDYKKWR